MNILRRNDIARIERRINDILEDRFVKLKIKFDFSVMKDKKGAVKYSILDTNLNSYTDFQPLAYTQENITESTIYNGCYSIFLKEQAIKVLKQTRDFLNWRIRELENDFVLKRTDY